jgi:hypothetical protein
LPQRCDVLAGLPLSRHPFIEHQFKLKHVRWLLCEIEHHAPSGSCSSELSKTNTRPFGLPLGRIIWSRPVRMPRQIDARDV